MKYALVAVFCVACISVADSRSFPHRGNGHDVGNGVGRLGDVTREPGRSQPPRQPASDRVVDTTSAKNETVDFDDLFGGNETEDIDAPFGRNETDSLEQGNNETSVEEEREKGVKMESEEDKSDEKSSEEKDESMEHSKEHNRFHRRGPNMQRKGTGRSSHMGRKGRKRPMTGI